jgi:hypothetical protein
VKGGVVVNGGPSANKDSCYVRFCGSLELMGFFDFGSEPYDSIKGGRLVE